MVSGRARTKKAYQSRLRARRKLNRGAKRRCLAAEEERLLAESVERQELQERQEQEQWEEEERLFTDRFSKPPCYVTVYQTWFCKLSYGDTVLFHNKTSGRDQFLRYGYDFQGRGVDSDLCCRRSDIYHDSRHHQLCIVEF